MMHRRAFIFSGIAAAVGANAQAQKPQMVLKKGATVRELFKDTQLTDQYEKPFLPDELFKEKQAIVVFGWGGCPMCQEITKVLAATQKKLLDANITDVPIVVISVDPETDGKPGARPAYVAAYGHEGVKEVADAATAKDKIKSQPGSRLLHVVCPATQAQAQELQIAISNAAGVPSGRDEKNPKQHSRYMFLLDRGHLMMPMIAKNGPEKSNPKSDPFVGAIHDSDTNDFKAPPDHIEKQSGRLLEAIGMCKEQSKKQGRG